MTNSKVPDNPKQHVHNLNFKNVCTDCGGRFYYAKPPDNPLEDADNAAYIECGNIIDNLTNKHNLSLSEFEKNLIANGYTDYFTSEADKLVEAVLDRLEEKCRENERIIDEQSDGVRVVQKGFVTIEAIEAERQRLNKEGE